MRVLTHAELQTVLTETHQGLVELFGDKLEQLWLYGSYARGEALPESDVDIFALVNMDREELRSYRRLVSHLSSDMDLKYNTLISIKLQDTETFWKYAEALPFYANVLKEGLAFCDIEKNNKLHQKTLDFRQKVAQNDTTR